MSSEIISKEEIFFPETVLITTESKSKIFTPLIKNDRLPIKLFTDDHYEDYIRSGGDKIHLVAVDFGGCSSTHKVGIEEDRSTLTKVAEISPNVSRLVMACCDEQEVYQYMMNQGVINWAELYPQRRDQYFKALFAGYLTIQNAPGILRLNELQHSL